MVFTHFQGRSSLNIQGGEGGHCIFNDIDQRSDTMFTIFNYLYCYNRITHCYNSYNRIRYNYI